VVPSVFWDKSIQQYKWVGWGLFRHVSRYSRIIQFLDCLS